MVYLNVYNCIFEYLEDIGMVDDVIEYSEEVLGPLLGKAGSQASYNEFIIEFALFNYMHNKQMLLDFISENLYPDLEEDDKKDFDLIRESMRFNLRFIKKDKIGELDTRGRDLYYFHFEDIDNNEPKIIVSSTALDEPKMDINARLINNPNHEGKYSIIGGIFDKGTFEAISELSSLKFMQERFSESKATVKRLLEYSKKHSIEEIGRYEDEKSSFLRQDRKIMRISRLFFEKFKIGIDDFLDNFFELSNSDNFIEMAEYYISIADDLNDTILDTNYMFSLDLLDETSMIEGFIAFIIKDSKLLESCIEGLKKRARDEFENAIGNEIALTRENIIKNQKKFLKEEVEPLNMEGYPQFFEKINKYTPEEVKEFLTDVVKFLDRVKEPETAILVSMAKDLLDNAEEIPYLSEIKGEKYIPERFYEYIETSDVAYDCCIFLLAAYYFDRQEQNKAYDLLRDNKIPRNKSFDMMFFIGKVYSTFDDSSYKPYFLQAKKIDKLRYRRELESYMGEKNER